MIGSIPKITIGAMVRGIRPRAEPLGAIGVITAYADDSGTHDDSQFIVYAAIVGTEQQWQEFEPRWRRLLEKPNDRRGRISEFRMADIETPDGEFADWSRAERDMLIHDFREIILDVGLFGDAFALDRKAWDYVFPGTSQRRFGEPEQSCFESCLGVIASTVGELREAAFSIVVDSRGGHEEKILDIFRRLPSEIGLSGISFARSDKITPLQAADMFAWETANALKSYYASRKFVPRDHLKHLTDSGRFRITVNSDRAIHLGATRISFAEGIVFRATDSPDQTRTKLATLLARIPKPVPKINRKERRKMKSADRSKRLRTENELKRR